jgi:hypothetical protein
MRLPRGYAEIGWLRIPVALHAPARVTQALTKVPAQLLISLETGHLSRLDAAMQGLEKNAFDSTLMSRTAGAPRRPRSLKGLV